MLIFKETAEGFREAEALHKEFSSNGRGRNEWVRVCSTRSGKGNDMRMDHVGKRLLFGYLATKEDLDSFNRHRGELARLPNYQSSHWTVSILDRQNGGDESLILIMNSPPTTHFGCITFDNSSFILYISPLLTLASPLQVPKRVRS